MLANSVRCKRQDKAGQYTRQGLSQDPLIPHTKSGHRTYGLKFFLGVSRA